jgi:hypothetical protein
MTHVWRPLSALPQDDTDTTRRRMDIIIRTPDGNTNSWRWLPYGRGSVAPYIGGRWQIIINEYGKYRNEKLPTQGEWTNA